MIEAAKPRGPEQIGLAATAATTEIDRGKADRDGVTMTDDLPAEIGATMEIDGGKAAEATEATETRVGHRAEAHTMAIRTMASIEALRFTPETTIESGTATTAAAITAVTSTVTITAGPTMITTITTPDTA